VLRKAPGLGTGRHRLRVGREVAARRVANGGVQCRDFKADSQERFCSAPLRCRSALEFTPLCPSWAVKWCAAISI
jgi:hypothetical protein